MGSKVLGNALSRACGASGARLSDAELAHLWSTIDEGEQRIASLMWALGIVRRGVEWQDDSPILRIIEQVMEPEEARGDPLGSNVVRMTLHNAKPPAAYYSDLDSA